MLPGIFLCPIYDFAYKIIASEFRICCNAVNINSGITVLFFPYFGIPESYSPYTGYHIVNYDLKLPVFFQLFDNEFGAKFRPLVTGEFDLLKPGSFPV